MSFLQTLVRRLCQLDKLFAPPPQLRRAHERFRIDLPVRIATPDHRHEAGHIAVDISDGGLFVEPRYPAEPGTRIQVSAGMLLQNADAEVVAQRGDGTAIRFISEAHGAMMRAWLTDLKRQRPH